jgi:Na+:H+ antiporter, NhaA family
MSQSATDKKFLRSIPPDSVPGALLVLMAVLAMIVVNSPWGDGYKAVLYSSFAIGPTGGGIQMTVAEWVKNALMAIFFFFVGLELKREILEGQLSTVKAAVLPVLAAAGGMAVPAAVYVFFAGAAGHGQGWAIPAATDIAFALGVLSLLGNRVPPALKAFLLAVAVVDDLGAIVIVALVYTEQVLLAPLLWAGAVTALLAVMNRLKLTSIGLYVLVGGVLWVFMHQSGVSATIAGVIVAVCVPLKSKTGSSPLHAAEHLFRPWVLFGVMPIFAFANAGVSLSGASAYLTHPITLGAGLGLAIGKPVGIALMTFVGAALLKSQAPGRLMEIVGVGCIAGIGFTMSLFVGALAFTEAELATPVRLGVYAGSIFSAALGLLILSQTLPKAPAQNGALQPTPDAATDPTQPFIAAEPKYTAHDQARP